MLKFVLLLISMFAVNAYAYPSQRYNDGRGIRSANPDPHHHHRSHHYSRDDYYGSRQYGGYDGYNRGGNYNGGLYPGQELYRNNGGLNTQSAASAGVISTPFGSGSYAQASANTGSGDRFF